MAETINITENTAGETVLFTGENLIQVAGDFGGGTLTIKFSLNNQDYVTVEGSVITEPTIITLSRAVSGMLVILDTATNPDIKIISTRANS